MQYISIILPSDKCNGLARYHKIYKNRIIPEFWMDNRRPYL